MGPQRSGGDIKFLGKWLVVGALEYKGGPLLLCGDRGRPSLGIASLRNASVTSEALSVLVGYALIHPVKVSIKAKRCFSPFYLGIWVMSRSHSSPG